jgi:hypothetical protein
MPVTSAISQTLSLRSSLIRPSTVAQFSWVWGPWSVFVFFWIIIQCRSAILKFVAPHRHFLLAKNVLPVNARYPMMNLALTHSCCLPKSEHHMDLKLGIVFSLTGHFVWLWSLDMWMENGDYHSPTRCTSMQVTFWCHVQSIYNKHLYL